MDTVILAFCSLASCIIIVNIIFQFMDSRYTKVSENIYLYRFLAAGCIVLITGANILMIPILNLTVHVLLLGLIVCFGYVDGADKRINRIMEVEALYIVLVVAETLGVCLLDALLKIMGRIPDSPEIMLSMETAFSKVVLIFLYYVLFSRFWKKTDLRTRGQYRLYLILFLYSMVNILLISFISDQENPIILIVAAGSVIFCDMYMLYFIRFSNERDAYKLQIEMMEQQEKLQYGNYKVQMEKYEEAMKIIHDVDKYVKSMETLYEEKFIEEAVSYAEQISGRLKGLLPARYSGNPILNCLLSEKQKQAKMQGIRFVVEDFTEDFRFMKAIDITTLFGNVIDNAIAAAAACTGDKFIRLSVNILNEMVFIRTENTVSREISIKHGELPEKGIGILNIEHCVEAFQGSVIYSCKDGLLCCDILLNRTDADGR